MTKQAQKGQSNEKKSQEKQEIQKQNLPQLIRENQKVQDTKVDNQLLGKKKVIKKFPFKSHFNKNSVQEDDDSLKGWKPTNISSKKDTVNPTKLQSNKKTQIATQFLAFLPKPANNTNLASKNFQNQNDSHFNFNLYKKNPKPDYSQLSKPNFSLSEDQMKWDAEDQFLSKKELDIKQMRNQSFSKQQKITEQIIEQDQGDEIVQKIHWLNENENENKSGKNIADLIQKTWERQVKELQKEINNFDDLPSTNNNNLASKLLNKHFKHQK